MTHDLPYAVIMPKLMPMEKKIWDTALGHTSGLSTSTLQSLERYCLMPSSLPSRLMALPSITNNKMTGKPGAGSVEWMWFRLRAQMQILRDEKACLAYPW